MSKCENCGAEMGRSKRFGARSCSDRCRKSLSRRKTAFNRRFHHIMSELGNIHWDLNRYPELRELLPYRLERLEAEVGILRRLYSTDAHQDASVTPASVTERK